MGSGASRLDSNGNPLPARLRPLFLLRLQEFTIRRQSQPIKDSKGSKKELLLHDTDDNISTHNHDSSHDMITAPSSPERSFKPIWKNEEPKGINTQKLKEDALIRVLKEESVKGKGKLDSNESLIEEDIFTDVENEDEDGDSDGRMIGYEDDEAFPGSPSFRVYFKDNGENHEPGDIGKCDPLKCEISRNDDTILTTESAVAKEIPVKKARKKRSFKKVFPKGGQAAMKTLLNVKSCYTPSNSSHDKNQLLPVKTTA